MARQWRIEYPNALYHILSRGNGGQDIFLSDDDRKLFISLLVDLSERFNINVYAYVLMNNHYHLLLRTRDANLSKAMQWLGTTYTRKFNINNHIGGHLFQGRFKSIIVENDAYLLRLSCYIHRNPLRAHVVDRLSDYLWSSYHFYAYRKKPPKWLKTNLILNQLSGKDKHRAYRAKVQQYSDEKGSILDDIKHGLIYGSDNFVRKIKNRFLGDKKEVELPQHNRLFRDFDLEKFLIDISKSLDFNLKGFRDTKKVDSKDKDKRNAIIYLLWKTGRLSNQQIGDYFGLNQSTISRLVARFSDKMQANKAIAREVNSIISKNKV